MKRSECENLEFAEVEFTAPVAPWLVIRFNDRLSVLVENDRRALRVALSSSVSLLVAEEAWIGNDFRMQPASLEFFQARPDLGREFFLWSCGEFPHLSRNIVPAPQTDPVGDPRLPQ